MKEQAQLTDSELELLSRSIDEELSELELKRLRKNVLSKPGAEQIWARYHAASAVMQKQFPTSISEDFSANVMRAVEFEEMEQDTTTATPAASQKSARSYMKQFAGLAVAASVAAVSVVMYQQQTQPGLDSGSPIIISDKREIQDFQPNAAASANSLPVEFSPVQVTANNDIIGLGDTGENFSDMSEEEITDLEEVIGLQDIK